MLPYLLIAGPPTKPFSSFKPLSILNEPLHPHPKAVPHALLGLLHMLLSGMYLVHVAPEEPMLFKSGACHLHGSLATKYAV